MIEKTDSSFFGKSARLSQKVSRYNQDTPGPGHYNQNDLNHNSSLGQIPREQRLKLLSTEREKQSFPGPANYADSKIYLAKLRNQPAFTMSKQVKAFKNSVSAMDTPGPDTYQSDRYD